MLYSPDINESYLSEGNSHKDVAVLTTYSMHTLKILKSFAEKLQEFLLR